MKNLVNLGTILNKKEQKAINGGWGCVELCPGGQCQDDSDCPIELGGGHAFAHPSCRNGYCEF